MIRGTLLLGLLLVGAGTASGHLAIGWGVHLDVTLDAEFFLGEDPRFAVELSNPTDATYSYWWRDGCYLDFAIYGEGRAYYDTRLAAHPCTLAVVSFDVPTWTAYSLVRGELYPALWQGYAGCVTLEVYLAGTVLQGSSETCPSAGPRPPYPRSTLSVVLPLLARSGETFPVVSTVRSTEGLPVEGAEVLWTSPGLGSGQVLTGADGSAGFNVTAPTVSEPTLLSLQLEAGKDGWLPSQATRHLSVFPAEGRALVLRVRAVSGDLVEVGGTTVIEVSVEDDRGVAVDGAATAFETSGPFAVSERRRLSPSSEMVRLSGGPTNGSATLRIVASAPGHGGTETTLDFLVVSDLDSGDGLPPTTTGGSERWILVIASVMIPAALFALLLARPRKREPSNRS